jgi:hypothetical protein
MTVRSRKPVLQLTARLMFTQIQIPADLMDAAKFRNVSRSDYQRGLTSRDQRERINVRVLTQTLTVGAVDVRVFTQTLTVALTQVFVSLLLPRKL